MHFLQCYIHEKQLSSYVLVLEKRFFKKISGLNLESYFKKGFGVFAHIFMRFLNISSRFSNMCR